MFLGMFVFHLFVFMITSKVMKHFFNLKTFGKKISRHIRNMSKPSLRLNFCIQLYHGSCCTYKRNSEFSKIPVQNIFISLAFWLTLLQK